MSDRSYPHITRLVMEKPWAILPGHLEAIRELVVMRAQGEQFSDEEIQERIGAGPAHRKPSQAGAVGVIPIYGTIVPKADVMSKISGGTSVADLRGAFMQAMSDPDIGAVLFDVDSPGGAVDQIPEFAADIRSQRGRKPMFAISNTLMGSAAYWLASQADEIAVSPSSLTGSIGVVVAHDDLSAAQEKVGVKTSLITAGKYKAAANPFEPLSDEARAHIQSLVDGAYQAFTGDVAKGRRDTVDAVRNGYGEGRVLDAKGAVKAGLADRIATLPQMISRAAGVAAQNSGQLATQAFFAAEYAVAVGAGPVAPKSTPTTDSAWDGPANESRLKSPLTVADAKAAYAWIDDSQVTDGTLPKSAAKFPHHMVGDGGNVGAANLSACSSGIAALNGGRGGANIPSGDRKGVWNHLAKHLRDGGKEPPPLNSVMTDQEGARGDASFADEIEAVLCMADTLVANGRSLTAAKRGRLESLGERISELCAVKEPSDPDQDIRARVASMRAQASIAATKLRSVQ
jgi:signal peptide peptidase SppA